MQSISNIISISLIGLGAAGFAVVSRPLLSNKEIDVPLNVLGINQSPYGEVFAMAMQGPIDSYWHAVESGGGKHSCDDEEHCQHEQPRKNDDEDLAAARHMPLNHQLRQFIEGLSEGHDARTNSRPASAAHKFHLRRGIEDKLRFAYNLDPSHYGNYIAYHFFLTQPQLGTRPELTPHAAKLAFDTINYCLKKREDPRQALTAAAAAGNVLELMLNDRNINSKTPRYSTQQMREVLKIMDQSITVYGQLADEWVEDGLWTNLSEMRIKEIEERFYFVIKVRESHEGAIRRLEGDSKETGSQSQTINHVPSNFR